MTRLTAGVVALLARGPRTAFKLSQELDERLPTIRAELERLEAAGVVAWDVDGWVLTDRVAA